LQWFSLPNSNEIPGRYIRVKRTSILFRGRR
jgi:hypothetical protein